MSQGAPPLTITLRAEDLSPGDWVEGEGTATSVYDTGKKTRLAARLICVQFKGGSKVYEPNEKLQIRLEDHGEEE
jgi:hypothetical protein